MIDLFFLSVWFTLRLKSKLRTKHLNINGCADLIIVDSYVKFEQVKQNIFISLDHSIVLEYISHQHPCKKLILTVLLFLSQMTSMVLIMEVDGIDWINAPYQPELVKDFLVCQWSKSWDFTAGC